jgi:predicted HTH transcriptional regulator
MTIKELHRLIRKGESQTLDFKKTVTHLDKIAKTMVSFANTKGGVLLIGVLDDGRIIGANTSEEAYALRQSAEHYCNPPVFLTFFEVEDEYQQTVLIADIAESRQKPHEALHKNGEWKAYVRMNDKSVLASKEMLLQLKKGVVGERKTLGKEGKAVLAFLEKNERLTARMLAQLINISDRRAKKLLIGMCQDGWLLSHGFEKETFYTLILG